MRSCLRVAKYPIYTTDVSDINLFEAQTRAINVAILNVPSIEYYVMKGKINFTKPMCIVASFEVAKSNNRKHAATEAVANLGYAR